MLRFRPLLPLVLLTTLVGCSDAESTGGRPNFDAGSDAALDGPEDAQTDATASDAGDDATQDAQQDVFVDAPVDGPADGPADVHTDVEPDAGDVWVELGPGVWVTPGRPGPGDTLRIRYEGAIASGTNVTTHYGYNGWNEIPGTGAVGQDDGTSNLDFALEQPLTPDGAGHMGSVVIPSGARAIHMVFRATQGGGEVWDNHGQRDYNLGVRFPYLGPFLTWLPALPPSEHVEVHFHTGMSCPAFVEHGQGSLTTMTPAGPGFMHHVVLSGLTPDTEYSYRVGCEGHAPSDTFVFRTAPASGPNVTFAVASDAQDNGETGRWGEIAAAIDTQQPKPAFVVFAGDLPWNDKPGLWWTFFDKAPLLRRLPVVAVPGNHDTPTVNSDPDTGTFTWLFGLDGSPSHRLNRVLRWGPTSFVLMSTETPGDFLVSGGVQYEWAQQQLATLSGTPWVFATLHIPPYNAGARHAAQQGDFRDLTQLFDGNVDWVFTGHEHLYQRMKPLQYNGVLAPSAHYGRGAQDGVGYLIAPPAGAWPESNLVPWDDPKAYYRDRLAYPVPVAQQNTAPSEQGFAMVSVAGNQITLRAYGIGTPSAPVAAHVVDQVTYAKP